MFGIVWLFRVIELHYFCVWRMRVQADDVICFGYGVVASAPQDPDGYWLEIIKRGGYGDKVEPYWLEEPAST